MALNQTLKHKNKKTDESFTTTILVNQTPKAVFDAINNVRAWWSGDIKGSTDKLGADFKYHYKDLHHSTQMITELVPAKKVVWHVVESRLNFVKDKTEWNDTDIVFEITKRGDKTELSFTHEGLVPALECYGACRNGWSFYINKSLQDLIKTGIGRPDRKEKGGAKKAA